jgi:hypothetical protein
VYLDIFMGSIVTTTLETGLLLDSRNGKAGSELNDVKTDTKNPGT